MSAGLAQASRQDTASVHTLPKKSTVQDALSTLDGWIARLLVDTVSEPMLSAVQEHMETGGKRVRARLTLQALAALGVDPMVGVPWAAACELMHNATLIHDDIQDGDTVRRGKPALWVTWGVPQAINAGDLLLMLPTVAIGHLECSGATRWAISSATARLASQTVCGQAAEMSLPDADRPSWDDYARAARGKTGAFFAMPIEGAALLAGLDQAEAAKLGTALLTLGELFQIRDDVLDLYGEKGREARGNDIREGKISALVAEHIALHPEDWPTLRAVLATNRQETSDESVEAWSKRFVDGGALAALTARAKSLCDALDRAPALCVHPGLHKLVMGTAHHLIDPIARLAAPSAPNGHNKNIQPLRVAVTRSINSEENA